jgi:hypothetical protein
MSIHVVTMFDVHMVGPFTKDCSSLHNVSKYVNTCWDNVWCSYGGIVPMCIIFPDMSIHVVTMFAMFIMSIQTITIEIEYTLIWVQSYFYF